MEKIKKVKEYFYLLSVIGIIAMSFCFAMPSILYYINTKTILYFTHEFYFLLRSGDKIYQTLLYGIILMYFVLFYLLIIKKRKTIFKNMKQVYALIIAVSSIFVIIVPFLSSDIFYYLGIGRLNSEYGQNPYYVTMKEYVDKESPNLENDTVMQKGYNNFWADTTVVYGPIWTIICSVISAMSFGNIDIGILVFKIVNLIVHILNCVLIYKLSNKKIFVLLYGLNPFILLEGISNVHNDIFIVFFILLAFYEVIKRKKLTLGLLSLAMATDIKYFTILILPLLVIYTYRNEKVSKRIIKCIQYGILFLVFISIPYLLYIKDLKVFMGMSAQRERVTKGFYYFISQFFTKPENLHKIIANMILVIFVIVYSYKSIRLLFSDKIKFGKEIKILYNFIFVFIFLLITNFQPWYFMWLTPFMIWQNSRDIKLIIQMQILTLFANMVFLAYSDCAIYSIPFFVIFAGGTLICILYNKKNKKYLY